jgi:hypothetical protein
MGEAQFGGRTRPLVPLTTCRDATQASVAEALFGGPTHNHLLRRQHVPRMIADPRIGEALFGGNNLQRARRLARSESDSEHTPGRSPVSSGRQDLHAHAAAPTFRERSRPHAWTKPCLIARTYNACTPSTGSESDHEPTHGRSPVWRADPRCSYERSVARRTPRVAARLGWSFLITP